MKKKYKHSVSQIWRKHRKNCECCHHHSVFKGHNVIVHSVVLNCQKCNQCLKCQVSGHKNFQKIWKLSKNLKTFQKSEKFSKIWKLLRNLKTFEKSENFLKILKFTENLIFFSKIWKFSKNLKKNLIFFWKIWNSLENLKFFRKSDNFLQI